MTSSRLDHNSIQSETTRSETVDGYPFEQAIGDYRRNLQEVFSGVLTTVSQSKSKSAGFPFASVVPFVLDKDGYPIIMAADISQHYRNMAEDDRVSLFLQQQNHRRANVQTQWRMNITAKAKKIEESDPGAQAYYRHYPASKSYADFHEFHFLKLVPEMVHIVQNFGQIAWLDPEDLLDACPLSDAEIDSAIEHMNEDHTDALYTYLQNLGETVDGSRKIELVSLNHNHFVVRHQNQLTAINYPQKVTNMNELRQAMIKLSYPTAS